jgi:hypothetical protein
VALFVMSLLTLVVGKPHLGSKQGGFDKIQGTSRFDSIINVNIGMIIFGEGIIILSQGD